MRRLALLILAAGLAACFDVASLQGGDGSSGDGAPVRDATAIVDSTAPIDATSSADLAGAPDAALADAARPVDAARPTDASKLVDAASADLTLLHDLAMRVVDLAYVPPDLAGVTYDLNNCKPVTENCTNGVDDDCDGLADCQDPDCASQGYAPIATPLDVNNNIIQAQAAGLAGSCGALFPSVTAVNQTLGPIACGVGSCKCTGTGTQCCGTLTIYSYNAQSCSGAQVGTATVCQGACTAAPANSGVTKFEGYKVALSPLANSSSCVVSGAPTTPTLSWATSTNLCASQTGSTGDALHVCAPSTATCFTLAGDVACPINYNGSRNVYYEGYHGSLSCAGACTCGTPSGGCTSTANGGLTLFDNTTMNSGNNCATKYAVATATTTCQVVSGNSNVTHYALTGSFDLATCGAATPPVPINSLAYDGPHTVCCR